jgi:Arabinose efflux permease
MDITKMSGEHREIIWSESFINIFIVNIVMNTGLFMMNTLIPVYTDYLGASAAVVGAVSSMFALTALCIRPIAGPAMDYFRKNRLLTAAISFITVAFIFYECAGNYQTIMIARLIHGIGVGFTAPLGLALASNALPDKKMAYGIGVFSLGQAVSIAVGPAIGLKLKAVFGYHVTFFAGILLMAFCLVLSLRIHDDGYGSRAERFTFSLDKVIAPEVIIPAVIMFFLSGAYYCINTFMAIYGGLCGVENIGLFFTAYAVFLLASRPLCGKIADKYGLDKIIIPGLITFAAAFLLVSFSRSLPMFLISGAVSAFGYGICQPLIQTLCIQLVSRDRRGVAGNTNYLGVDCGTLIGPSLAGVIITHVYSSTQNKILGYVVMYRCMVIPILVGLLIFVINRKKLMQKIEEMTEERHYV